MKIADYVHFETRRKEVLVLAWFAHYNGEGTRHSFGNAYAFIGIKLAGNSPILEIGLHGWHHLVLYKSADAPGAFEWEDMAAFSTAFLTFAEQSSSSI